MAEKKVYGLILPKSKTVGEGKTKPVQAASFNVFGDDSDEEETKTKGPVAPYKQGAGSLKTKRQAQMDIDKALQEDPNIFEYDELYDEMQANKPKVGAKEDSKSKKDMKPRYITGLLKAAEVKKKDEERRKERQVQKEREAEGEKFADKEKFVTSAYRKKMLEMQEEEEREKREAAMEALTDVTKQKDMSGFYRYLYRQTAGDEVKPDPDREKEQKEETNEVKTEEQRDVKEEPPSPSPPRTKRSRHSSSSSASSSSSSNSEKSDAEEARKPSDKIAFSKPNRPSAGGKFRKRADSSSPEAPRKSEGRRSTDKRRRSRSPRARSPKPKSSRLRSPERKRTSERMSSPDKDKHRHNRERDSSSQQSRNSDTAQRRKRSRSKEKRNRSRSPMSDRRGSDQRSEREQTKSGNTDAARVPDSRRSGEKSRSSSMEGGKENSHISENLKAIREDVPATDVTNAAPVMKKIENQVPVDPAKKVYPHHNSPKDIVEARKRYLQRKIARERERAA